MSKRDERAAAAAKVAEEARRRERRSTLIKVGAVVVAMLVIVGIGIFAGLHRGGSNEVDTNAASSNDASSYSMVIGDKNAPHTVVIYEDFQCPYCRDFEAASRDGLAQAAAQGKVRVEYRPFNFLQPAYSAQSLNAFAHVLKTSGTEVAKKFHDLLYENQPKETGPWPAMSKLVDLAVQAGADKSAVQAGILDTSSEKAWVQGATQQAQKAGVQATPTVLLDGQQFQDGATVQELAANLLKAIA
jgi:protein-disulfide isomerase